MELAVALKDIVHSYIDFNVNEVFVGDTPVLEESREDLIDGVTEYMYSLCEFTDSALSAMESYLVNNVDELVKPYKFMEE